MRVGDNSIQLGNEGIIYDTLVGSHNLEIAIKFKKVITQYLNMVNGKALIFADNHKGSVEARRILKEISEHDKVGKAAIYGVHPVVKVIASFARELSKNKNIRIFNDKYTAISWLKKRGDC